MKKGKECHNVCLTVYLVLVALYFSLSLKRCTVTVVMYITNVGMYNCVVMSTTVKVDTFTSRIINGCILLGRERERVRVAYLP